MVSTRTYIYIYLFIYIYLYLSIDLSIDRYPNSVVCWLECTRIIRILSGSPRRWWDYAGPFRLVSSHERASVYVVIHSDIWRRDDEIYIDIDIVRLHGVLFTVCIIWRHWDSEIREKKQSKGSMNQTLGQRHASSVTRSTIFIIRRWWIAPP